MKKYTAIIIAAISLVACSESTISPVNNQTPESISRLFYNAIAKNDIETAMKYFPTVSQNQMMGMSANFKSLSESFKLCGGIKDIQSTAEKVGDTDKIKVISMIKFGKCQEQKDQLVFVKQDGNWLIDITKPDFFRKHTGKY